MSNVTGGTTIVGGGIGGFTVAQELRKLDPEVAITIIDPEGLPYDRPPLSKEVLAGEKTSEELLFVPASWYTDNHVEVITGKVIGVDAEVAQLSLEDGTTLAYENLVLATGGSARRGQTPGFEDNTLVLRTLADAIRLAEGLGPGLHLGIIGAGLIGAEVAAQANALGAKVTLVEPQPVSLIPAVGEDIATRLHALHGAHGVDYVQGMTTSVDKDESGYTIVVDCAEGGNAHISVDKVLLSIGLIPDESLARELGLDCDNGVLVDHQQRTAVPNVWAVGDCARRRNADGTLERRHEHWDSAVQEGRAAAYSIAGQEPPAESASWFWSDRYGVHVEGTGDMNVAGQTYFRPDADGKPAVAFRVTNDNHLAGAAAFNDSMAIRAARRIIDRNLTVDPAQLIDPAVSLKKLAR
ncbi:FAD-dependent oxidoreductase [Corynebacterium lizhenjunii]|uniref:FAD-dependent oxidoreductase n=1 Tax=Corynebacterium lizhenjunii TaxID=2709394 RepID=A0A7T0PAJ2_9CORY|nr:FAD-dependent oxidoreductase [Corynebacterium lizhenjunii]QPK79111.1 FAD-dependent oxidoreductase [Corynebacterium lizhenjunii]